MKKNWFALFVKAGQEDKVKMRLEYRFHEDPKVFVPKRIIMERKKGIWYKHTHTLFPGYIFLCGEILDEVLEKLRNVPGIYKLLCTDRTPVRIPNAEIEVFTHLMMDDDCIDISEGYWEGDEIKIIKGPLLALMGSIVSIDKRKGRARVKLSFLGEERVVDLGLDMIDKEKNLNGGSINES
jgi:transcriptional antiterminator NusG